jgi:hypothetical protein
MISLSGPGTLARHDRGHHRRPTRGAAAAGTVASSAATMGASADQTQPSTPVEVNGRHARWRRLPLPSSFKSALAEPALVTQNKDAEVGATPGTTATTTAGSCRHPVPAAPSSGASVPHACGAAARGRARARVNTREDEVRRDPIRRSVASRSTENACRARAVRRGRHSLHCGMAVR